MTTPCSLDVLVVDDEETTRHLLSQILGARGLAVRSAADGFEALQRIQEMTPDLLLSDLNMPGMSGFELLSVVRRLYPEIHVIATSGAYSGVGVPNGIAADGFHEKATGLAPLFGLLQVAASEERARLHAARSTTPLWVDLERREPEHDPHVLINCSKCLRPFRQPVQEVDASIRQTTCVYCASVVAYALALAIRPA